jgi:glucose-6-phosphate 1-dehydrogenase
MAGDPTLFAREDSIEESWRIVEPILTDYPPAIEYDRGSWGPAAARDLVRNDGHWPEEPPGVGGGG